MIKLRITMEISTDNLNDDIEELLEAMLQDKEDDPTHFFTLETRAFACDVSNVQVLGRVYT